MYFIFCLFSFHIDSRFVARPFTMTNPSYIFFFFSVLTASKPLYSHDLETAQNGIYSALSSSFHNLQKGLLYGAIKPLCFWETLFVRGRVLYKNSERFTSPVSHKLFAQKSTEFSTQINRRGNLRSFPYPLSATGFILLLSL